MRILVTGGTGLVGREVVRIASESHDFFAPPRSELDVRDEAACEQALARLRPDAVLHCAAETNVDRAERFGAEARESNALSAARLARKAHAAGVLFVYVSTNFVFDGEGRSPYREEDETNPLSSYARTKLEGEALVAKAAPGGFLVLRTGWLYGRGKGFVDWAAARLAAGEELPLVEDEIGSPTSASELARAMMTLVERNGRGLFHFVNRGEVSWLDFGRAVAEELGVDPSPIRPLRSADLGRPARRPRYCALSVERYEKTTGERVKTWREALKLYLAERASPPRHRDTER
jgi:dTDP-4-dehydrorhamnose reductase